MLSARSAVRQRDEALLREIRYCYEKARFDEANEEPLLRRTIKPAFTDAAATAAAGASPTAPTTAASATGASSSSSNWLFRLNLAQHLLSEARAQGNKVLREHHYGAAEAVLRSIAPRTGTEDDGWMGPVYTALGTLYLSRSVSALSDGDLGGAGSLRAQALASFVWVGAHPPTKGCVERRERQ
jgi:hypothetical protein